MYIAKIKLRRLLKHALELRKPVLMINLGPSRADGVPGVEKLEVASGAIMTDVVKAVMQVFFFFQSVCPR